MIWIFFKCPVLFEIERFWLLWNFDIFILHVSQLSTALNHFNLTAGDNSCTVEHRLTVMLGAGLITDKRKSRLKEVTFYRHIFYYHTHFHWKKRYTNFGQNGGEIWKIIEIGIDMYIYSWSGRKKKTFSKNVCLSVRAQKLCTLKLKNG